MNYAITVMPGGAITVKYAGPEEQPAPWIAITADQYAAIVPGSAWSGSAVVAPAPYTPPVPTPAQAAATAYAAFIAGGLTITSTAAPALNGVYAIDADSQSNAAIEAQFISTYSEFTNETTSNLLWQLANGSFVTFPSTAEFLAFAKVAGQTVAAAKLAASQMAAGLTATMPTATATIP